jgi:hypothetical protein
MPLRKTRAWHGPDRARPRRDAPEKRRTLDTLSSVAYEEMRRVASFAKRTAANTTLSPTTLANETWLKLANSGEFASQSRLHFKRIAETSTLRRRMYSAGAYRHTAAAIALAAAFLTARVSGDGKTLSNGAASAAIEGETAVAA